MARRNTRSNKRGTFWRWGPFYYGHAWTRRGDGPTWPFWEFAVGRHQPSEGNATGPDRFKIRIEGKMRG